MNLLKCWWSKIRSTSPALILCMLVPGSTVRGTGCSFTFNSEGGMRFGGWTGNNLPETGQVEFTRKLGIILDGYLYSAPAIRDTIFTHGEITGRFTREQVQIWSIFSMPEVCRRGSPSSR